MRDPTFPTGLSAARYYPLETPQTTAEHGGESARIAAPIVSGGRRARRQRFSRSRRQRGGAGLFGTGGVADLVSAYSAGVGTTVGVPSQGIKFSTIPPITDQNTNSNGSPVSKSF
jgi:hypothetical protein